MPATAGRVPMPAGNRVITSNALKVSDRWSSIVGSDPYASDAKGVDGNLMEKMWADPRLHGDKKHMGQDAMGKHVYQTMDGAARRDARASDALAAREREYELMQEKKRRGDELRDAEQELMDLNNRPAKKAKKEKKEKKEKKAKKSKKGKKEKKDKKEKKSKKSKRSRRESGSDSSSSSESESESEDNRYKLSGFFNSKD